MLSRALLPALRDARSVVLHATRHARGGHIRRTFGARTALAMPETLPMLELYAAAATLHSWECPSALPGQRGRERCEWQRAFLARLLVWAPSCEMPALSPRGVLAPIIHATDPLAEIDVPSDEPPQRQTRPQRQPGLRLSQHRPANRGCIDSAGKHQESMTMGRSACSLLVLRLPGTKSTGARSDPGRIGGSPGRSTRRGRWWRPISGGKSATDAGSCGDVRRRL